MAVSNPSFILRPRPEDRPRGTDLLDLRGIVRSPILQTTPRIKPLGYWSFREIATACHEILKDWYRIQPVRACCGCVDRKRRKRGEDQ